MITKCEMLSVPLRKKFEAVFCDRLQIWSQNWVLWFGHSSLTL